MAGSVWLWLAFAGLGAWHGLNPAMGWLFAVGLGLQERSRKALFAALVPIALGHALAISLMVFVIVLLGITVSAVWLQIGGATEIHLKLTKAMITRLAGAHTPLSVGVAKRIPRCSEDVIARETFKQ